MPWIMFPNFQTQQAEEKQAERQILCQFKSLFNKRRQLNKDGARGYDLQVRQFDTTTQLIEHLDSQYDHASIMNQTEDSVQKIRLSQLGFQTLFAYAQSIQCKRTQDEVISKRISRYLATWQNDSMLLNLLVTRYNFPTSLFDPQNMSDSFEMYVEKLSMNYVFTKSTKSVGEFLESVKGDLLSEFILGYQNFEVASNRNAKCQLNYRKKRDLKNKVISELNQLNMKVPDELMQVDQENIVALSDAVKRCLQIAFYQTVHQQMYVVAGNTLSQMLSRAQLLHMDPKMSWNYVWKRIKYFINETRILDSKNQILFHDTIYLNDSEELSFLLLAMYVSNSLLRSFSISDVFRDFSNLVLVGDSGLGKSFAMEALTQILRTSNLSSVTLNQMFSHRGTFAEAQIGSASAITCSEVNLKSLFTVEAKEYLDVSLPVRKVDVKFKDPVTISKGIPFFFASNDFPGDVKEIWEKNVFYKDMAGEIRKEDGLKDQWVPVMRRLCFVPYVESPQTSWLKRRNFVEDFCLMVGNNSGMSQKLPFVCSLLGTAFLFNSRIKDHLKTEEDVRLYARFMRNYEKTFLSYRIKYMSNRQFERLQQLFSKYCCFDLSQSQLFKDTETYKESFLKDATSFCASQECLQRVKRTFLSTYERIYTSTIKVDRLGNRMFTTGYNQKKYQTCLLQEYTNAFYKSVRVQNQNQIIVSESYLSVIKHMNTILPSIPVEVVIDQNIEGRRQYRLPQGSFTGGKVEPWQALQHSVMAYFIQQLESNVQKFVEEDYDSVASDKYAEKQATQVKRFDYLREIGPEEAVDEVFTRDLENKKSRMKKLRSILRADTKKPTAKSVSLCLPTFSYASDGELQFDRRGLNERNINSPLRVREVPCCLDCGLIKTTMKHSLQKLRRMGSSINASINKRRHPSYRNKKD